MTIPKCRSCKFLEPYSEESEQPECRRYPPTAWRWDATSKVIPTWPRTTPDHWCGEHSPGDWSDRPKPSSKS